MVRERGFLPLNIPSLAHDFLKFSINEKWVDVYKNKKLKKIRLVYSYLLGGVYIDNTVRCIPRIVSIYNILLQTKNLPKKNQFSENNDFH